jgi:hypothetical protein
MAARSSIRWKKSTGRSIRSSRSSTARSPNGESTSGARADLDRHVADHLEHEERDALPLVDRSLTPEQWMKVGQGMAQQVGPDMPRYLPWLLEGADDATTSRVLAVMPPPVREAYADQWRTARRPA